MCRYAAITLVVVLCLVCHSVAEVQAATFFGNLYDKLSADYAAIRGESYATFCQSFDVEPTQATNRRAFHEVCFLHDLFTGSNAVDFSSGGILKIPYFWHWVSPNPRHSITYLATSASLSTVKPPKEFSRYHSYADIDRVPSLYLSDLLLAKPKYSHPQCGTFYTFGWCSEREMAFTALLSVLGYHCKIVQRGIHTWSEVWVPFLGKNGTTLIAVASVDNTFDTIRWAKLSPDIDKSEWLGDCGSGAQIKWYNSKARSTEQLELIRSIKVPPQAAERIEANVREWMKKMNERLLAPG